MSPAYIFLILFGIVALLGISQVISSRINTKRKLKKENEDFKTGKRICIHTKEDCENCMAASRCIQREGKGLLQHNY